MHGIPINPKPRNCSMIDFPAISQKKKSKGNLETPRFYAYSFLRPLVIGGASLTGGSGTIFGAILGVILLSVVSSSLALLDVSVYWQDIIRGSILLAAVSIDHYLHKKRG